MHLFPKYHMSKHYRTCVYFQTSIVKQLYGWHGWNCLKRIKRLQTIIGNKQIGVSAWIFEIQRFQNECFFLSIFEQNKVHNPIVNAFSGRVFIIFFSRKLTVKICWIFDKSFASIGAIDWWNKRDVPLRLNPLWLIPLWLKRLWLMPSLANAHFG